MPAVVFFDLHDDGCVRPSEKFREDDAGLRVSVVVGLKAGKDQVELLVFDGGGESFRGIEGVESDESGVFEVDGAVGALGESFAQNLRRTSRAGGDNDDFPAVLFLLAKRFFEGIGVGFVDFVGNVFADPGAGFVEFERRVFLRDLLHADEDFHGNS